MKKNIRTSYLKTQFLGVKFSIYLNRRVFVLVITHEIISTVIRPLPAVVTYGRMYVHKVLSRSLRKVCW